MAWVRYSPIDTTLYGTSIRSQPAEVFDAFSVFIQKICQWTFALLNLNAPVESYGDLGNPVAIKQHRNKLHGRSGIYGVVNLINGKRGYIGSAENLGIRMNEHVRGYKSNAPLQAAINKSGLGNFIFVVYGYAYTLPGILNLETEYILAVPVDLLYNIKMSGTSMLGYKHTAEAKLKMSSLSISQ